MQKMIDSPMIRVVLPDNGEARGSKVFMPNGDEIPHLISIEFDKMEYGSLVKATLEVLVRVPEFLANPMLGLDTVRQAAWCHGFDLVARSDADEPASGRTQHVIGRRDAIGAQGE